LFAAEHVEYAVRSDFTLERYATSQFLPDSTDDARIAMWILSQQGPPMLGLRGRNNGNESALIYNMKRIETKQFAVSLYIWAHRNRRFIDIKLQTAGLGQLDRGAGKATRVRSRRQ